MGGRECIVHVGRIKINLWSYVDCGLDFNKPAASFPIS